MANLHLTMASWDYDHIRDLASGEVRAEGIDLTHMCMRVEEIFYRFAKNLEWDVSELSFAKYCSMRSYDEPPIVGIPVFVSRVFRHSAFYIRKGGRVERPEDLAGKRVGIPEWTQTATVYARGLMVHQYGIPLTDVEWVQAGVDQPGRVEMADITLPDGVRVTPEPNRNLTEMLLAGDLDAVISAHPPHAFLDGNPDMARLFPDYRDVESRYFGETGIYPIMHTVAIKRSVFEAHPWIAMNLLNAFEEAKQRALERLSGVTASRIPMPWVYDDFTRIRDDMFAGDYWPYGIEPNRTTIEAFLQYCHEQGVTHRRLQPEDLYPEEVQTVFRV